MKGIILAGGIDNVKKSGSEIYFFSWTKVQSYENKSATKEKSGIIIL